MFFGLLSGFASLARPRWNELTYERMALANCYFTSDACKCEI